MMERRMGRATVAIHNSYDPKVFREAHRRILARAGPLALAFDYNLVTFGFPFPDDLQQPLELAEWVASSTSIGEDGSYLKELAAKGRFQSFPYPAKGLPPQLGVAVLTTCDPDPAKKIDLNQLSAMLASGQSVCLIFGAGPKGVPKKVRELAKYNLDITFNGHSLETCTALGAVTGALAHRLRS
ncbi:MAG: DUF531 domain-containing protein [Methanomassiliicoccales archaeon]|nr:DUF531 domain-containing protein [Methanomassiliicoccales archaeon]